MSLIELPHGGTTHGGGWGGGDKGRGRCSKSSQGIPRTLGDTMSRLKTNFRNNESLVWVYQHVHTALSFPAYRGDVRYALHVPHSCLVHSKPRKV